jgi:hypothetical protein
MRRAVVFIAVALVTLSHSTAQAAPQEKTASGKVTAVSADSITVDVKEQAMTFTVNTSTTVVARGAGTKAREARKMTGQNPKLTDVITVGENVEVRYTESGGTMLARTIHGVDAPAAPAPGATKRIEGVVSEVAANALTIKPASGEAVKFVVDAKAEFTGRGLGTMAKRKAAQGAKLTLTDAVAVGDTVDVTYKMAGDVHHATLVWVIKKGT